MTSRCKSCGSELDARGVCAACESSAPTVVIQADESSAPTEFAPPKFSRDGHPSSSSQHSPLTSASVPAPSGRSESYYLVPGTVLAARYRIVAPIGKGGMGHVYRAEDLKLGETVALKFLPETLAADPAWLGRFFLEVRTARDVTHPNVCRVHDVVEAQDPNGKPLTFLTMEFVDGETLADIVRRFGRLPSDKAMELGAEICSALAAAHQKGVLHRDIKPANILVDGRGQAKLADFGLATGRGAVAGNEIAGTPGYIAPELLRGGVPTGRSDLYALGLVLYELLTGHRAVKDGKSQVALAPGSVRKYAPEIPADVESVVLACAQPEPEKRPVSAAEVASAFPQKQNALDAALARGETPSPELVAASADDAPLTLRQGWLSAGAVVLVAVLTWVFAGWSNFISVAPPQVGPEETAIHARDLLRTLGYDESGVLSGIYTRGNFGMLDWYAAHGTREQKRNFVQAPQGSLFYRYVQTVQGDVLPSFESSENFFNAPAEAPLRQAVVMDSRGNLLQLSADPYGIAPPRQAGPPDWSNLLAATGLNLASLRHTSADFDVPFEFSERQAWTGSYPGHPEFVFRVNAAAWQGRPNYLRVEPVTWLESSTAGSLGHRDVIHLLAWLAVLILGCVLAVWNIRRKRGDIQSATRLGLAAILCEFLAYLGLAGLQTRSALAQSQKVAEMLAHCLLGAATVWLAYVAVEPLARKRFPRMLQGSTLLLQNHWRNPRVGRELLTGAMAGAALALSFVVIHLFEWHLPGTGTLAVATYDAFLTGLRQQFFGFFGEINRGISLSVDLAIVMTIGLLVLRNRWLAALVPFMIVVNGVDSRGGTLYALLLGGCVAVMFLWLLLRYGILATATGSIVAVWLDDGPWPHSLNSWMVPHMLLNLAWVAGITGIFFWLAIGRRNPFGSISLES